MYILNIISLKKIFVSIPHLTVIEEEYSIIIDMKYLITIGMDTSGCNDDPKF